MGNCFNFTKTRILRGKTRILQNQSEENGKNKNGFILTLAQST